ncbi:MAG: radical SAM/Cys-rich domain protein [bacterium]|nr:radical SAM/Cys-rich domain protein [bacterium]
MTIKENEQLGILANTGVSFTEKLEQAGRFPIKTSALETLQLNVGRKCNLACKHCHVNAGPDRDELMSRKIFEKCLDILRNASIPILDITGGAPEMNPHLEWFMGEASQYVQRLIVRSNLVILTDEKYAGFMDVFCDNKVKICASLPHYTPEQMERQRGCGTFDGAIDIIKKLNERGYGVEGSGLVLDLVHNPVGAFMPGRQKSLESEFKRQLFQTYGISFNTLFCITNMPLGRYLDYLMRTENLDDYMSDLANAFNPCAAENVMCKNTLSVSWDGTLYNCDFNQMVCLVAGLGGNENIMDFEPGDFENRNIEIHNHCFGCTAGSGSSCQGATDD